MRNWQRHAVACVCAVLAFGGTLVAIPIIFVGLIVLFGRLKGDNSVGDSFAWIFVFGFPLFAIIDLNLSAIAAFVGYTYALQFLGR